MYVCVLFGFNCVAWLVVVKFYFVTTFISLLPLFVSRHSCVCVLNVFMLQVEEKNVQINSDQIN